MSAEEIAEHFSLKTLPHSEAEFAGDIPYEALESQRAAALKEFAAAMELPGFRKGHVPESMALARLGEMSVLEEALEHFLRDFYPALLAQKKIDAVGRPAVRVTKIAMGQPVSITIRTAVYPEITLPKNFRELAKTVPEQAPEPVNDKEFEEALEQLRKSRATKAADGSEQIPELNDEFAKSIGSFESLEDLKTKLRKGIAEEKARAARDKRRGAIIEALLEKTSVDIPHLFIESEIERTLAELRADVARFGLTFEEYLKRTEKSEEALRKELEPAAEKRAKLQLTLNEIAEAEKIAPDREEVEREISHALSHNPDADPEALGIYIQTLLRNEQVLRLLEETKN